MKTKVLQTRNFLIFVFVCLLQMTIVKPIFSQSRKKTFADSFRIRFIIAKPWLAVIFLLLFSGFTYIVNAQTVLNPEWIRNYSERDSITNIPAAIDANGNIYVTGSTYVIGQNYNVTTIKYNQNGDTVWVRHYNGTANGYDGATALGLDGSGNILITGRSQGIGTGYDILTLKYNASGTLLWEQRFDGPIHGNDTPSGLALDNSGNVYVTGYSVQAGTTTDFITIKYSSTGVQNWVKTYNGPGNGNDRSIAIYLKNNRVFITGFGYEASGTYAATTISYLGSNGNQAWIKKYGSITSIPDAGGCAISQYGANIFVSTTTGTSGNYDYTTIAYNNANGNQQWLTIYNAYNLNDIVSSATTDNNGNIFVTGRNLNSNGKYEYHTVKYSQSGVQQWVNKQQVNLTNARTVNKITVDTYNMIYVCGEKKPGYNSDMFLCQITQGGNTQWTETYNGQANGDDAATDMVTDYLGRIFLTGQTYNGNAKFDYTTIKYSQSFIYYPPDFNNEPASSSLSFYENRGQIINTNNNLVPDVRYYSQGSYPSLYFTNTILSYVFSRVDTSVSTIDTIHRIDQILLNSNPLARVFANETAGDYLNYFLGHCPQGITDVKGFKRLFIPNIYPNIDLHYFSNASGIKYYFVVRPGGNPKDIALQYAGAVNAHIEPNGHLTVNSSIGNIEYDVPTAYQVTPSQNIIPLNWTADWQYFSSPNAVFFKTGNYNTSLPLIIQVDLGHMQLSPQNIENLEWSTYYGGSVPDGFMDIKTDNDKNIVIAGYSSSIDFPVLNGFSIISFSDTYAAILKFDPTCKRVFATLYGGNYSLNFANSLYCDNITNNIYVVGWTRCIDFPILPLPSQPTGAYVDNSTTGSMNDGFILELDQTGSVVIWNTFYGDDAVDEYLYSITGDNLNNIYIVGKGNTDTDLHDPQNGAYYNETTGDGLILKFTKQGARLWATLFPIGSTDSKISDVVTDVDDNVFITGAVVGNDLELLNPGNGEYYDDDLDGSIDAFITKFNSGNVIEWSTYFGGSSNDIGNAISAYDDGDIFITGTTGSSDYPYYDPGTTAFCDNQLTGTNNIFIARFDNEGFINWSTYYGNSNDGGTDIITTDLNAFYVTGTTHGLDPVYLTAFYNQSSISNSSYSDAFILGFTLDNNELFWATYFGGSKNDNSQGIVYTSNFRLYITGFTNSLHFNNPAFPIVDFGFGAWIQWELAGNSSLNDGFISRFSVRDVQYDVNNNAFEKNDIIVFPNPSEGIYIVKSINNNNDFNAIKVYNSLGDEIFSDKFIDISNVSYQIIDLTAMPCGIYLIVVSSNTKKASCKVIKN